MGAVPPIHIIVDNGRVTLKGVVDNQSDDSIAKMAPERRLIMNSWDRATRSWSSDERDGLTAN
jgi:hypothetical protein